MACSVAGITSDANVLTTYLRQAAQKLVAAICVHREINTTLIPSQVVYCFSISILQELYLVISNLQH